MQSITRKVGYDWDSRKLDLGKVNDRVDEKHI